MPDLDPTLARIDERLVDLATACGVMDAKLDAVRLEQAAARASWDAHCQVHGVIDKRLDGVESREREATASQRRHKDSDPPRRQQRGVDMAIVARVAAGIGIAIAVALSAWTSGTSASSADVQRMAVEAARAAAVVVVEAAREGTLDTDGEAETP